MTKKMSLLLTGMLLCLAPDIKGNETDGRIKGILMPGLMIYILYTLLGQGIMKQFAASEDYVYQIYTVDLPEAFSYLKTESDLEVTEITVSED